MFLSSDVSTLSEQPLITLGSSVFTLGEVVLFIHGFPTIWYSMIRPMEHMRADYRVVAIDGLGAGLSDAPSDVEPYKLAAMADHLDALIDEAVPASIRLDRELSLPEALSETAALAELREIMGHNQVAKSFIGQGYHGTITPSVILRNILENPSSLV